MMRKFVRDSIVCVHMCVCVYSSIVCDLAGNLNHYISAHVCKSSLKLTCTKGSDPVCIQCNVMVGTLVSGLPH